MSRLTSLPLLENVYCIDVECVACGKKHTDRSVAQIAVVNAFGELVFEAFVKPSQPVVSYLTPLTGLNKDVIDSKGVDLETALSLLRSALPSTAVLVGQGIENDIRWLRLQYHKDYADAIDLSILFQAFHPRFRTYMKFSLDHTCRVILGVSQTLVHNAVTDAQLTMQLYRHYMEQLHYNPPQLDAAKEALLKAPPTASFRSKHPLWEGVCMGHRKKCVCGGPSC